MSNLDVSAANGLLKVSYGKDLIQMMPDNAILQKEFPLSEDVPLVGSYYAVPVGLRSPQGHNFGGSSGGVYTFNSPIAGKSVEAQVTPFEYLLRDYVSYGLLDRAGNGGERAFESAMAFEGAMMAVSARNMLEIGSLHGQQGIGNVSTASGTTSHVNTFTLTAASLSPGILAILEGCLVDFCQSDLATYRSVNSATYTLTVTAVDLDAGTVTITESGSLPGGGHDLNDVTTGDIMFVQGAAFALSSTLAFAEQLGLGAQLAATTGTQFNIPKATYSAFRASIMSTVGEFTPSSLVTAATKAQNRGFVSGELVAIMGPRAYGVLNSALATEERWNDGKSSMSRDSGTDAITVKNNSVKITALAHPFQKQGQIYIVPRQYLKRIGAIDLTFVRAGGGKDEYLYPVSGQSALERQARANWQIFDQKPNHSVIMTGITYS